MRAQQHPGSRISIVQLFSRCCPWGDLPALLLCVGLLWQACQDMAVGLGQPKGQPWAVSPWQWLRASLVSEADKVRELWVQTHVQRLSLITAPFPRCSGLGHIPILMLLLCLGSGNCSWFSSDGFVWQLEQMGTFSSHSTDAEELCRVTMSGLKDPILLSLIAC